MIVDLEKYLFFGAQEDLDEFFSRAQAAGIIQFLSAKRERGVPVAPNIQETITAIKLLRKQPLKAPYTGIYNKDEAESVVDRIVEIRRVVEKLQEQRSFIQSELARVRPLGNFSIDEIRVIEKAGHLKFQFFCVKSDKASKLDLSPELIYVGTEYDLDYFCYIGREEKQFPGMIEMHVEKTAPELRIELQEINDSLVMLEEELKSFAGHIRFLRTYLSEELNGQQLYSAKIGVSKPLNESLFSVEGWVPKNKVKALETLTENLSVIAEKITIEKSDQIPTHMENEGLKNIGEDLVNIYDTPAATDKDPSGWVFWSFALFFAIIVGDGGYGILYLALAAYIKYKFPNLKGKGKRIYRLVVVLATSCIIWGVFAGSFFGISFGPKNPIAKISVFQNMAVLKADYHLERRDATYQKWINNIPALQSATTGKEFLEKGVQVINGKTKYTVRDDFVDGIFLELALLIGVIHIALSLLRYCMREWANIGWFAAVIGGYLFFPIFLKTTSILHFLHVVKPEFAGVFGKQLLFFGIGLAVVLALIQKRLRGLGEITNSVQIFGDVLSYLRLYALALASAILAQTANNMGANVGWFFGILVILFGHGINIALGLMSAVIHGLRLNFIEWYHYSYEGGGKLFVPLKKLQNN